MWVSVMMPGSHGMSRLHVCVDMISFPFGRIIFIGCVASCMFTAADLSMRKCPVTLESEKAHSTAFFNLIVLKMVFAVGSLYRMLARKMCCHDVARVVTCRGSCEMLSLFALVPCASLL